MSGNNTIKAVKSFKDLDEWMNNSFSFGEHDNIRHKKHTICVPRFLDVFKPEI